MSSVKDNRRKRQLAIIAAELAVIGILFIIIGCGELRKDLASKQTEASVTETGIPSPIPTATPIPTPTEPPVPTLSPEEIAEQERLEREAKRQLEIDELLEQTDLKAAMYDYEASILMIKEQEDWEEWESLSTAVARYEEAQSKLVVWPDNTQISHLFVHSLIVDPSRTFGPKSTQVVGYNQWMTTVTEFNLILEEMYSRGYVLISPHDMAEVVTLEDGTQKLVTKEILLPEGKIPFVLSQDDVNYYAYMEKDGGFADKIVVGEDGLPTCQYTDAEGNIMYGEYDMLPIVDRFVREHPDFSYHGRKGILAVTGYEGALGYDTGLSMAKYNGMSEAEMMEAVEAERELVREVVAACKADGWEFASHSYTHSDMQQVSYSKVVYDTTRWHDEVESLIGETDIYIYPYGADICDWRGYSGEKYELLHEEGFWYFCNVDASNQYWVQIRDGYLRQGRINADGLTMHSHPERLKYFFDAAEVIDPARPDRW